MNPLLDVHDQLLFPHLSQVIPDLKLAPTNPDLPDFSFQDYKGEWVGVSLKGVGEILSGLDRVTEQLQRDVRHVSSMYLVVTGVLVPVEGGTNTVESGGQNKMVWFQRGKGWRERAGLPYSFSYLGYRKWLETLSLYGIETREPANRAAQVITLQAIWEHHQAPPESHTSFSRVMRTKLDLPEEASPFVKSLMGLADAGTGRTFLGQEYAQAIAGNYKSLMEMCELAYEEEGLGRFESELAEVRLASGRRLGPAMAKRVKEALG